MNAPRAIAAGLALAVLALVAPQLAPHDPSRQFSGYPFAPPMRPHVVDRDGRWHWPFAYGLRLIDPLERRYVEDEGTRLAIADREAPAFLLGTDALGRDVLSRTLAGARWSLGVALAAAALALLLAALVGAIAGYAGGWIDAGLMRVAEYVLVLPAVYVALALRGALPLVLGNLQVFAALVAVFGLAGWPAAARGVRGIITTERTREYAEAARALGASPARVLVRHLLPATAGFLVVQGLLLIPAFVVFEATLSFVGFGFLPPTASWGTMLQDVGSPQILADAPWLLAPAAGLVLTILFVHLASGGPIQAVGPDQDRK